MPAVKELINALSSKEDIRRWEAAKTLSQIGDASATEALIKTLNDKNFDNRWLAAEGLISIGEQALVPLLNELIRNPESEWLREGTHRYLHEMQDVKLRLKAEPVMRALEKPEASLEAPLAAEQVLKYLI
jgi:HEAT repeat protein